MRKVLCYFSKFEIFLWLLSVTAVLFSFITYDRTNYLALAASLIGLLVLLR